MEKNYWITMDKIINYRLWLKKFEFVLTLNPLNNEPHLFLKKMGSNYFPLELLIHLTATNLQLAYLHNLPAWQSLPDILLHISF